MLKKLQDIESDIPRLLDNPNLWNTLDINYFPPRVERLWTQYDDSHRLFIHIIHTTDEPCLFHKHRWESAFKMLKGKYEMGIAWCEDEVTSEQAYNLPVISKFILNEGSYYEMINTHTLHYVKPLGDYSISLMLTGSLYEEASYRKELKVQLEGLSEDRKIEILNIVKNLT